MKRIKIILGLVGAAALTGQADAQAVNPVTEEDQAQFTALYDDRLRAVQNSRSTDDDLELAEEMYTLAGTIPDSPGVQCLLYIETIPLAAIGGDLSLSNRSAGRLNALWPGHEAAASETLLNLAARAYREASRPQRDRMAEAYLDLLLAAADEAEDANDLEDAIGLCRLANTIARSSGSDQREHIEGKLEQLSKTSELINRTELLAVAVRNNPKNSRAARELVNLLVVQRDMPEAAAEFAPLAGDPDLAEIVAACAGGIDQSTAPEALRVGDWFLGLADDAKDEYAGTLLRRALAWYARFMDIYPRDDALAKRVAAMAQVAHGRSERLALAQRLAMRGQWIDLVKTAFNPARHTLGDQLTLERGEIHTRDTSFVIPVRPEGDYELRVKLTIHRGTPGLTVHMPVGNTAATIHYAGLDNKASSIEGLEELDFNQARMNRVGTPVELTFQCAIDGTNMGLAMLVDGDESLGWRGLASEVRPDDQYAPPREFGEVLRFTCPGDMTVHHIELRERR